MFLFVSRYSRVSLAMVLSDNLFFDVYGGIYVVTFLMGITVYVSPSIHVVRGPCSRPPLCCSYCVFIGLYLHMASGWVREPAPGREGLSVGVRDPRGPTTRVCNGWCNDPRRKDGDDVYRPTRLEDKYGDRAHHFTFPFFQYHPDVYGAARLSTP